MHDRPDHPLGRRRWLALAARAARLALRPARPTAALVQASYDRIAPGYDRAWTHHMRGLSLAMLDRLAVPPGARCLDLTCGTGFLARELSLRSGTRATGVDASAGMLAAARAASGDACCFVHADILPFLRSQPRGSFDVVTCGWGLGYSRPLAVVRQIARVLRAGGRVGIIDNTLFSLAGVLWASAQAFAERPAALAHVMRVRFLPHPAALAALLRAAGLAVPWQAGGARRYTVPTGAAAIERLTATGAAAGFESAAAPEARDAVFARFAEVIERRFAARGEPVTITHRWLAAVGRRGAAR